MVNNVISGIAEKKGKYRNYYYLSPWRGRKFSWRGRKCVYIYPLNEEPKGKRPFLDLKTKRHPFELSPYGVDRRPI